MTEQEQVQVTLALRERHEAAESLASAICGCATQEQRKGDIRAVLAFAQEVRHTATSEALEAMREAREALQDCAEDKIVDPSILVELRALCERHGYGNVMSSASGLWRQALGDLAGGEFVAGPCRKTVENRVVALTAAIAKIEGEQP
jgi:hypothetical protein